MYQGKRAEQSASTPKKKKSSLPGILLILLGIAVILAIVPVLRYLKNLSEYNPSIHSAQAEISMSVESGEGWDEDHSYIVEKTPYDASKFHRDEKNRIVYEDDKFVSQAGIDVSVWQGSIDWEKVKADGIDFVIIRLGYMSYKDGEPRYDSRFAEYLEGVENAGIPYGIYFYSNAVSVTEAKYEAEGVIRMLGDAKPDLPIFYDWERTDSEGDRTLNADAFMISACCRSFCDDLSAAGYDCGIYLNSYLLQNDVYDEFLGGYPIWMAEYDEAPTCVGEYSYWQYTNDGRVDGINEQVDMDIRFVEK